MKITTAMAQKAAAYLEQLGWMGFDSVYHSPAEVRKNLEQLRKAIEKAVTK